MLFKEIEAIAQQEVVDIERYLIMIQTSRNLHPEGAELTIPSFLIPHVERHCDKFRIPLFHVTGQTVSTAETYSHLLAYESGR
jgi:hypothetical protein